MHAKPKCPRYRSLDIWRGIACLMVVLFHTTVYAASRSAGAAHDCAWWAIEITKRMWAGVPLFFVISGYCISATADATRLRGAATRNYFWRRFRRIFPPYWIMLALYALFFAAFVPFLGERWNGAIQGISPPWDLTLRHWVGTVSLTEVWSHRLLGTEPRMFLEQAWSLCYEEIFYAVVGLLLAFSRQRLFPALAAFSLLAVGACAAGGSPAMTAHPTFWLLFAAGVLVYYQVNYATTRQKAFAVIALLAGIAIVVAHPGRLLESSANPPQFVCAAFPFALLLMALHRADGWLVSRRCLHPLEYCGTLCYSLYLVHWPVAGLASYAMYQLGVRSLGATLLVTVPVAAALSVALAHLFHRRVERHFLNAPLAQTARTGAPRARPAESRAWPIPLGSRSAAVSPATDSAPS